MDEKKKTAPPAVGGSSLLTVFAVLALTVFALLSLSTVRADVRLADAAAEAVTDYYAADCRAQEILARLRAGGPLPEGVEITGSDDRGNYMYYTVPISDTQELQVEVYLAWDEGWGRDASGYTILRWQAASSVEWMGSDSFTVWDGE